MLLALLEKKLDIPLRTYDVFVNISGGIRVNEPSIDLAVIASILSSYRDRELNRRAYFLGEVSLLVRNKERVLHSLNYRRVEKEGLQNNKGFLD